MYICIYKYKMYLYSILNDAYNIITKLSLYIFICIYYYEIYMLYNYNYVTIYNKRR